MGNITINPNDVLSNCSLLCVFSPTPEDRSFRLQMQQLEDRETMLLEHDVFVAEIFECDSISPNTANQGGEGLREQLHVPKGSFRLVLIGKDAHVKMVSDSCVSLEEVVMRVENEPRSKK
jgi:hypothetical protein